MLRFDSNKSLVYSAIIIDYSECYCANIYSDGEIEKVFNFNANIDNKQRQGGQSAPRFARIREGQITQYFKKIDKELDKVKERLYVGMSSIYYRRFYNTLKTYNKEKIIERRNIEYSGITGMQQFIKIKESK